MALIYEARFIENCQGWHTCEGNIFGHEQSVFEDGDYQSTAEIVIARFEGEKLILIDSQKHKFEVCSLADDVDLSTMAAVFLKAFLK